ncbi:hypothetical protein CABS01_15592 [Colletotrichum abscissum]|uniref:uncharacterized protein n=1 Tax=Colletotrichum abscissum TaxID=1671311 RepID=UPI0027D6709A|nr:uncharacterized protein CABS01_15592 [Colletotrichum abscissum]KAK1475006.1 hypothetical protein CABS01_15592 [Colletotrichum abscissum]
MKLVVEDFKVHGRQIPLVAFRVPSSDSTKNLAPLPPFTSLVLEKLGIQDRHSKGLSREALLALQPHQPTRLTCSSRRWCDKPCRAFGHPPGNSVIARPLALADLEKTTHPGTSLSNGFQACLPLILTEYLESSLVRCAPRPPTIQTELLPSPQCKSIAVAKTTATRIVRGRARAQMQSHMPPEVHSAEGDENGLSGPVTDDQSRGEKPTLASTARIAIHAMSSSAHVLRPYCMSLGIDRSAAALSDYPTTALKSSPGNRCLSGGGQRLHRDSSGQSRSRSSRIPECGCSLVYRVAPFGFYTP